MSVQVIDAVRVHIEDDRDLSCAFLDWIVASRHDEAGSIESFRGGGWGMGELVMTFPAEYKERIEAFFAARSGTWGLLNARVRYTGTSESWKIDRLGTIVDWTQVGRKRCPIIVWDGDEQRWVENFDWVEVIK